MNILISSTSFIMPDNSSWSSLKEKYKIKFSEYGNLFSNNFKKSQDLEIKIIFLNDIVNYYTNSKKDFSKNANRLKKIQSAHQISDRTKVYNLFIFLPIHQYRRFIKR